MMKLTEEQYELIHPLMPVQRGNVRIANLDVAENGCKWRGLQERFGNWHTIYRCLRRWAEFQALQEHRLIRIRVESVDLDSASVKVHPDGTGARIKRPPSHRQAPRRMEHQDSSGCRG